MMLGYISDIARIYLRLRFFITHSKYVLQNLSDRQQQRQVLTRDSVSMVVKFIVFEPLDRIWQSCLKLNIAFSI